MLLSQLRWLLALAIGVAVMIAVYMDPEVEAPGGTLAPKRPAQIEPLENTRAPLETEESQRAAFERARAALLEHTPEGPIRDAALASLRRQYLPPDQWNTPISPNTEPSSPALSAPSPERD